MSAARPGAIDIEAPFAVYQTDQEGETRLFATGLYRDRLERAGEGLRIAEKLVLLDTVSGPDPAGDPALKEAPGCPRCCGAESALRPLPSPGAVGITRRFNERRAGHCLAAPNL